MNNIKLAKQGIHQNGFSKIIGKTILKPGDVFIAMPIVGTTEDLVIPVGCIGVIHIDIGNPTTVSVIRDDCKAARKALRAI